MKLKMLITMTAILMLVTACVNTNNETGDIHVDDELPKAGDSQLVTYGVAGLIQEITLGDDEETATIFVEGELGKNGADYHRAYVRVTGDTVIYGKEESALTDLQVGQYVNVFFEGAVMESDPVQATAKQINIVPEEALEYNDDPTEE